MAKVLVQETNGAREFELMDLEVSIGRELDNSLRLADPSISRHHAVLRHTDAGYEVEDLGSSNGVLLNGNRVQTALLQDGDRITLGQLQLTYVDPKSFQTQENPLGTVRMTREEMAKFQASTPGATAAPAKPLAASPEAPAKPLAASPEAPAKPLAASPAAPEAAKSPAPQPTAYISPMNPKKRENPLLAWLKKLFGRS